MFGFIGDNPRLSRFGVGKAIAVELTPEADPRKLGAVLAEGGYPALGQTPKSLDWSATDTFRIPSFAENDAGREGQQISASIF